MSKNDDDLHAKLEQEFEQSQLHFAAQDGDLARIESLLLQGHDVNRFDDLGDTPLHHAVRAGHLDIVERLLEAGAEINAHDERVIGNTPLSDIAGKCSFEMAHRLIEAGADPTIRGWMQLNAIDCAAQRVDADARKIRNLLTQAADRIAERRGPS